MHQVADRDRDVYSAKEEPRDEAEQPATTLDHDMVGLEDRALYPIMFDALNFSRLDLSEHVEPKDHFCVMTNCPHPRVHDRLKVGPAEDGTEGGGADWRAVTGGLLDEAALSLGAEPIAVAADGQHVAVVQEPAVGLCKMLSVG
ncbi:hypothetical protein AB7M47_008252 [Bradyrhizobium elkanii]|jgi:hypothetical protein